MTKVKSNAKFLVTAVAIFLALTAIIALTWMNASAATDVFDVYVDGVGTDADHFATTDAAISAIRTHFASTQNNASDCEANVHVTANVNTSASYSVNDIISTTTDAIVGKDGKLIRINVFSDGGTFTLTRPVTSTKNDYPFVRQNYNFHDIKIVSSVTSGTDNTIYISGNETAETDIIFGENFSILGPNSNLYTVRLSSWGNHNTAATIPEKITVTINSGSWRNIEYVGSGAGVTLGTAEIPYETELNLGGDANVTLLRACICGQNYQAILANAKSTVNINKVNGKAPTIATFATIAESYGDPAQTNAPEETVDFDININAGTITKLWGVGRHSFGKAYTVNGSVDYVIGGEAVIGNLNSPTLEGGFITGNAIDSCFFPIDGYTVATTTCKADVSVTYRDRTFAGISGKVKEWASDAGTSRTVAYLGIANDATIPTGTKLTQTFENCTFIGDVECTNTVDGSYNTATAMPTLTNNFTDCTINGYFYGADKVYSARRLVLTNNMTNVHITGSFNGGKANGNMLNDEKGNSSSVTNVFRTANGGENLIDESFYGVGTYEQSSISGLVTDDIDGLTVGNNFFGVGNYYSLGSYGTTAAGDNKRADIKVKNLDVKGNFYGITSLGFAGKSASTAVDAYAKSCDISVSVEDSIFAKAVYGLTGTSEIDPKGGANTITVSFKNCTVDSSFYPLVSTGTIGKEGTLANITVNVEECVVKGLAFLTSGNTETSQSAHVYGNVTLNVDGLEVGTGASDLHLYTAGIGATIGGYLRENYKNINVKKGWFPLSVHNNGSILNAGNDPYAIIANVEDCEQHNGSWMALFGAGAATTVNGKAKVNLTGENYCEVFYGANRVAAMPTGCTGIELNIGAEEGDKLTVAGDFVTASGATATPATVNLTANINGLECNNFYGGGNNTASDFKGVLTTTLENALINGNCLPAASAGKVGTANITIKNTVVKGNFAGMSYTGSITNSGTLTLDGLDVYGNFVGGTWSGQINNTAGAEYAFKGDYKDLRFLDRDLGCTALNDKATAAGSKEQFLTVRIGKILGKVDVVLDGGTILDSEGAFLSKFIDCHGSSGSALGESTFTILSGDWGGIHDVNYADNQTSPAVLNGDLTVVIAGGSNYGFTSNFTANSLGMNGHKSTCIFDLNNEKGSDITVNGKTDAAAYNDSTLIAGSHALILNSSSVGGGLTVVDKVVIGANKVFKISRGQLGWGAAGQTAFTFTDCVDESGNATDFVYADLTTRFTASSIMLDGTSLKTSSTPFVYGTTLVLKDEVKARFYFPANLVDKFYEAGSSITLNGVAVPQSSFVTSSYTTTYTSNNGTSTMNYYYIETPAIIFSDFDKVITVGIEGREEYTNSVNDLLLVVASDEETYGEDFANLAKATFNLGAQANFAFDKVALPTLFTGLDTLDYSSVSLAAPVDFTDFGFKGTSMTFNEKISLNFYALAENDVLADVDNAENWALEVNGYTYTSEFWTLEKLRETVKIGDIDCNVRVSFEVDPQFMDVLLNVSLTHNGTDVATIQDSIAQVCTDMVAQEYAEKDLASALLVYVNYAKAYFAD